MCLRSFMSIVMPILIGLHVIVCVLMILVVLMQRPRSEGLGAAFGGGMTENIFGAQTTHVLARFTTWMAAGFFGITLLLSILTAKSAGGKTAIQERLLSAPVPAASPAATEPAPAAEAAPVVTDPVATSEAQPVVTEQAVVVEETSAPAPVAETPAPVPTN